MFRLFAMPINVALALPKLVVLMRKHEVVFVMLLAAAIGVRAIFDLIVASYADRNEHKWLWVASGVLGLIAAVVILVYPVSASVTFVWVLGLYTLIHGVIALAYAAQIRGDVKKAK